MSRKKYIIFVLLFTIPAIPFSIYLDSTKFKGAGTVLYLCLQSFVCFFTSYLLICKKKNKKWKKVLKKLVTYLLL